MKKNGTKVISRRDSLFCYALYAFCGTAFAVPMIFPTLFPLVFFSLIPVFICEIRKAEFLSLSYFAAFIRGFVFFFFFSLTLFSWFVSLYPLDFLGFSDAESLAVVIAAMTGLPVLQSVFSALLFVYIHFLRKRKILAVHPLVSLLGVALLYPFFEWIQNFSVFAMPWGKISVGLRNFPAFIQSASLFGSYFVSFLVILINALAALIILSVKDKKTASAAVFSAVLISVFTVNTVFGVVRIGAYETPDNPLKVAALQGNIRYEDKYLDKADVTMRVYRELALSAAKDGAEIIVYPETALPFDLNSSIELSSYYDGIESLTGKELIASAFRIWDGGVYNVVFAKGLTSDGTEYRKNHLVPFGEYVPMKSLLEAVIPPLASLMGDDETISAGDGARALTTAYGKVVPLVCFDSIFDDIWRDGVRGGGEIITVSTNDSWFTGSVALEIHEFHSRLRAIESGKYVIRAANTGISAIITPAGEVTESLGDSERGYITGDVEMLSDMTLYGIIGNAFIYFGVLSALLIPIYFIISERRKHRD